MASVASVEEPPSRLHYDEITIVHFTVGQQKAETALVPKHGNPDDIKDLFRSACEAGPCDIVKLYTPIGHLISISNQIPPNDATAPYRLHVVGLHSNGILVEEVGMDLLALDKRVSSLEERLRSQGSCSEEILGLKTSLTALLKKVEELEELSWLGFYKGLHPLPLPKEMPRQASIYHPRSLHFKDDTCNKFLRICDVSLTEETLSLLSEATFDNWAWEDEELLLLLQTMFLRLDLLRKFNIEIQVLRSFLMSVYRHYNDVPFHNFRHSFCVSQMMFGMMLKVGLGERVGELETLILLTSSICHDLDHPGYNNIYQINAQTELALRYNDISPLENHHCSTAFRILATPESNILRNFDEDTYRQVREGIIRCILATDMARHNEILHQFKEMVPLFEPTNRTHVNLLSMVLIKVADISNEARPMSVAEPWLDCLLTEFFQQSDTEKLEGLPVTPYMDRDKITKPSSQCSFIGLVLLPLFEALASLFTELDPVIIAPVRYALDYYRRLNEASQILKHRRSTDVSLGGPHRHSTVSHLNSLSDHMPSEGRKTRENSLSADARNYSVPALSPNHDQDTPPSDEESDWEGTLTEVVVSERALKFKIATESSMELTASRKGSRENRSESSDQSAYAPMPKDDSTQPIMDQPPIEEADTQVKAKPNFFSRLRIFTERLSSPRPTSLPGEKDPLEGKNLANSTRGGFSYFRRPIAPATTIRSRPDKAETSSRRPSGSESEAAEASGSGRQEGSLESILSKEDSKSPLRKVLLPRFSSFVQKKMLRKSPKRHSSQKEDEERN